MKKYIKFAYHMLCSNMLMNILIIIQLAISFALLQGMTTYTINKYKTVLEFDKLSNFYGVHFCSTLSNIPDSVFNDIHNIDENIDIINSIRYSDNNFTIEGYTSSFVKYYKPDLSDGCWFDEYNIKENIIPVVAFGDYRIGDLFQSDLQGVNYEIIGVMERPYYFSFASYGAKTDTDMVMQKGNPNKFITIITDQVKKMETITLGGNNSYILISDNSNYIEPVTKILNNYGYVSTFSEIKDRGIYNAYEIMKAILPFFVVMFIVSLLGMIGCISLSIIKQLKMCSVLFIVGGSQKKCVIIILTYIFMLITCSLVVYSFIGMFIFKQYLSQSFAIFTFIPILIICIITLCTAFVPITILKKSSPLEILKNTD